MSRRKHVSFTKHLSTRKIMISVIRKGPGQESNLGPQTFLTKSAVTCVCLWGGERASIASMRFSKCSVIFLAETVFKFKSTVQEIKRRKDPHLVGLEVRWG